MNPCKRIPSCEPCRLVKLACDHQRPVCSRCTNRSIRDQCIYRKDPFKRAKIKSQKVEQKVTPTATGLLAPSEGVSIVKLYPNPGFQGPSSLSSVLDNLDHHGNLVPHGGEDHAEGASRRNALLANRSRMVEEGVGILDMLFAVMVDDFLYRIFSAWHDNGLESHLGAFLVDPFVKTIKKEMEDLHNSSDWRDSLLAVSQRMFDRGNQALELNKSMALTDFVGQFTGSQLRWETVGIIMTLVGIAAGETRAPNPICKSEQERQTLRMNMINCSTKCASFCESFDTLNEVQVIFLYQNYLLQSVFYGDQSYNTWHAFNDAANALLAAGLHQRVHHEDCYKLPEFLLELRKRILVHVYAADIALATFLGRPPRLSKRFCTAGFPVGINEAITSMWREQSSEHETILRWTMVSSMIREDVLELLLNHEKPEALDCISVLRTSILEAWGRLPVHLAPSSFEVWQTKRDRHETERLHLIRLYFLHTVFLIEWAAWRQVYQNPDELFRSATELLTWVNQALIRRENLPKLGFISLAWRVTSCALPAAGVLSLCLTQPYSPWWAGGPDPVLRRQAVENLCLLTYHLDVLHGPSDGNYELFLQAKRTLQSVLESLLQPPAPGSVLSMSPRVDLDLQAFYGDFWCVPAVKLPRVPLVAQSCHHRFSLPDFIPNPDPQLDMTHE